MKISTETQQILKNFSTINKGILFKPGTKLLTRTDALIAEAIVTEDFPLEKGIGDLSEFLSVLSLFTDPELNFGENVLTIAESDGSAETLYGYAPAGIVTQPHPKKKKELPAETIEFLLNEEQWGRIQKAVSIFKLQEVKITSDGKVVRIGTSHHKNSSSNSFSIVLDAKTNELVCDMTFSKDQLPLLKGSYQGFITPTYTVFKNTSGLDLNYYVGADPVSTFGTLADKEENTVDV